MFVLGTVGTSHCETPAVWAEDMVIKSGHFARSNRQTLLFHSNFQTFLPTGDKEQRCASETDIIVP